MKNKQKIKNWIVLISAVVVFFLFYFYFALRLGSNVRSNVSQGSYYMVSTFLDGETKELDEKIYNISQALSSSDGRQYLSSFLPIKSVESEKGYYIDGEYLKYSDGNKEVAIELASLFNDNPLISGVSLYVPDHGEWHKGDVSPEDYRVEFSLEKTGVEVAYYFSSQSISSSQERGIALVVRNVIYVAILFIVLGNLFLRIKTKGLSTEYYPLLQRTLFFLLWLMSGQQWKRYSLSLMALALNGVVKIGNTIRI